jgi:hypothetical protein
LLRILEVYEAGSGQKLNLNKTHIFFSRNTSMERKHEILLLLGLTEAHRIDKYLELPSFVGKSRNEAFKYILEKVSHKLENWKIKFLSQAGKEILLKAVIQAIPTYSMGVFQLPISLCKELNQLMQSFWWSHMSNNSKIWMSWAKMGRSKSIGGLGFRDLVVFNKAFLAKQGWRILQDSNSVAAQILKAKYFPKCTFLEAPLGSKPSFAWRSLFNDKDLLSQGLIWRIGNGKSVKIWGDRWLPTPTTYVAELIDEEQWSWKVNLLQEVFSEEEAKIISNIPLSPLLPKDKLIWRGTTHGEFSVRSAYHLGKELQDLAGGQCSSEVQARKVWKALCALEVPN